MNIVFTDRGNPLQKCIRDFKACRLSLVVRISEVSRTVGAILSLLEPDFYVSGMRDYKNMKFIMEKKFNENFIEKQDQSTNNFISSWKFSAV